MLFLIISILGLAAVIRAAAIPSSNTTSATTLAKREVGSCDDFNLPMEWYYNLGVGSFCSTFHPTAENKNPGIQVDSDEPYVYTVELQNYKDNAKLNWVYKIWIDTEGTQRQIQWVDYDKCMRKMKEILSEGQLGKAYCVVDGTEDVLFQAGRLEEKIRPWGKLIFESYRRRG
jgi:hypothetical protein